MAVLAATHANIQTCAERLRAGELIAMPTETVYGLAADATNATAVAQVYASKHRPKINPLICHVSAPEEAFELGVFNAAARRLAAQFWPGPLTLVVPRSATCAVSELASAGLATLALRCPNHAVARALLTETGRPLVAPSANPSGQLSPSQARHVHAHMPDIDVLDGGACAVGVESTIVGCHDEAPTLLRVGGLSRDVLEAYLDMPLPELAENADRDARLAPGRMLRHYAPRAPLCINGETPDGAYLLLGFGPDAPDEAVENLSPSGDLNEAAANLFDCLHRLDARAAAEGKAICVSPVPTGGLGDAINDRLKRAAQN